MKLGPFITIFDPIYSWYRERKVNIASNKADLQHFSTIHYVFSNISVLSLAYSTLYIPFYGRRIVSHCSVANAKPTRVLVREMLGCVQATLIASNPRKWQASALSTLATPLETRWISTDDPGTRCYYSAITAWVFLFGRRKLISYKTIFEKLDLFPVEALSTSNRNR